MENVQRVLATKLAPLSWEFIPDGYAKWNRYKISWKQAYSEVSQEIREYKKKVRVPDPKWTDLEELSKLKSYARELLIKRYMMKAELIARLCHE